MISFLIGKKLKPSDIVINGGGGSENKIFIDKIGTSGKIYSFDPNQEEKNKTSQIEIHPYVLYSQSGQVNFCFDGTRSRVTEDSGVKVDSISIDDFISKNKIERLNELT